MSVDPARVSLREITAESVIAITRLAVAGLAEAPGWEGVVRAVWEDR